MHLPRSDAEERARRAHCEGAVGGDLDEAGTCSSADAGEAGGFRPAKSPEEWHRLDFERIFPCMEQSYSKTILIKFDVSNFNIGDSFFLQQKEKVAGTGPFSSL